jgi:hypothetical protein
MLANDVMAGQHRRCRLFHLQHLFSPLFFYLLISLISFSFGSSQGGKDASLRACLVPSHNFPQLILGKCDKENGGHTLPLLKESCHTFLLYDMSSPNIFCLSFVTNQTLAKLVQTCLTWSVAKCG